ncbi:ABC transporter permease [Phaeobacter sp. B1627]|uniref:ABC transporter permease n=1 Tax=Phaeobacter sp. B1627 TaxID=2583809 RepID=UPI001118D556|nr:ABC transporter permease [Phaeobacter sp. B1627]TNJ40810.1 ABC transporter permease [Phaeobacter sp. B1627]
MFDLVTARLKHGFWGNFFTSAVLVFSSFAVVAVLMVGAATDAKVDFQIDKIAADLLVVEEVSTERFEGERPVRLYSSDVVELRKSSEIAAASAIVRQFSVLAGGAERLPTDIYGIDHDYISVMKLQVEAGRVPDMTASSSVAQAVLGSEAARRMGVDPMRLPATLRVGGQPIEIIGIFADRGWIGVQNIDLGVYLSRKALRQRIGNFDVARDDPINAFIVRAAHPNQIMAARNEIYDHFGSFSAVSVSDSLELSENAQNIRNAYNFFHGSVFFTTAGLALGLSLLFFFSRIASRRRQFGMALTIGASRSRLVAETIVEVGFLTVTSVCAGVSLATVFLSKFGSRLNLVIEVSVPFAGLIALAGVSIILVSVALFTTRLLVASPARLIRV